MKGDPRAAVCGDYCAKCPNFGTACRGCIPSEHGDCQFVTCTSARGVLHCGLCPEFPCRRLSDFVPDDSPGCSKGYHVENLRRRMRIGDDAWLKEQAMLWCDRD